MYKNRILPMIYAFDRQSAVKYKFSQLDGVRKMQKKSYSLNELVHMFPRNVVKLISSLAIKMPFVILGQSVFLYDVDSVSLIHMCVHNDDDDYDVLCLIKGIMFLQKWPFRFE